MENYSNGYAGSGVELNSPPPIELDTDEGFEGLDDAEDSSESEDDVHVTNRVPEPDSHREEMPPEEEEQYESAVHKASSKGVNKTAFNQVQREKYQALHANELLRQENERIKRDYELSTRAAMQSYDETVMNKIDKARRAKAEAIESGDVTAQVDADTQLALAINEYKKVEDWKAEQNYSNQYREPMSPISEHTNAQREYSLHAWTGQKEFLNPSSQSFDKDLAYQTASFAQQLDNALYQRGESYMIGTPQYLDYVDQHINLLVQNGEYKKVGRSELNMKPSRQGVSPVRNGFSQGRPQQGVKISADEKDMVRRLGISEKDYVRRKALDQRHESELRRGR